MKRATALPEYHDLQDFDAPDGLTEVQIDPATQELATPACPKSYREVFIAGTEPTAFCDNSNGSQNPPVSFLSHLFGGADKPNTSALGAPPPPPAGGARPLKKGTTAAGAGTGETPSEPTDAEKKPGIFRRIFGIFGGSKTDREETPKN
jgi:penicillin-binding protein 1B